MGVCPGSSRVIRAVGCSRNPGGFPGCAYVGRITPSGHTHIGTRAHREVTSTRSTDRRLETKTRDVRQRARSRCYRGFRCIRCRTSQRTSSFRFAYQILGSIKDLHPAVPVAALRAPTPYAPAIQPKRMVSVFGDPDGEEIEVCIVGIVAFTGRRKLKFRLYSC